MLSKGDFRMDLNGAQILVEFEGKKVTKVMRTRDFKELNFDEMSGDEQAKIEYQVLKRLYEI